MQSLIAGVGESLPAGCLSVTVRDLRTDVTIASINGGTVRSTASVGKLLLLIAAAVEIAREPSFGAEVLTRNQDYLVADAGLWQELTTDRLPAGDVAALIGAVSDNAATNVLLRRLGLDAANAFAQELGLGTVRLHDRVRDVRGPDHTELLSSGTTDELVEVVSALHRGLPSAEASNQVTHWLRRNVVMPVAGLPFGLDPLDHVEPSRGAHLWNKTGTDTGVRADVGVLSGNGQTVAYAVAANWPVLEAADPHLDDILAALTAIGSFLRPLIT